MLTKEQSDNIKRQQTQAFKNILGIELSVSRARDLVTGSLKAAFPSIFP